VTTRLGVQALLASGIDMLIHLGDVGSVEVIDEMAVNQPDTGKPVPARLVFGNSDWDIGPLGNYAKGLGIQVDHPVGRIELDAGELVFCHGHQAQVMAEALAQDARYLCHGHTHQASDTKSGSTRIINPGALCRAHSYTVAVLDTSTDELAFLPVPAHG
jgi:putative phosphoesterase